jgi:cytochrome c553
MQLALVPHLWAAQSGAEAGGAAVYRRGVLPSGAVLVGDRETGVRVEGRAAACTTCHRPSGLGTSEGGIVVPPIIGKYLFRSHATNVKDVDTVHVLGYRSTREPYTDATLAHAIRTGTGPNGRTLNYLMPRYNLDDETMASLIAYLKQLTSGPVPGVSDEVLDFATIITPDADPVAGKGMLDVMEHFFADKNSFIRGGIRPMHSTREIQYRVSRRWQLHEWRLTGEPSEWGRQLDARLAAEPVFAVISGLGGGNWEPVHQFCQRAAVPCLFPNVELPIVAEGDFYPVYFSRGVLLEADLIGAQLAEHDQLRRVVQVYREGDIGEQASAALTGRPALSRMVFERRSLHGTPGNADNLADAVQDVGPNDALVLWLRPQDLAKLPMAAADAAVTFMSGSMGGNEHAPLAPAWRTRVRMAYPIDLPNARSVRMNFPLSWFNIHHIPVVAERVQTDTYIACGVVAETLTDMLDSFVRDYLVERLETMLSHRLVNGYYPRLSLAPGQRFASKGGYMVHFTAPAGTQITADTEWTVP